MYKMPLLFTKEQIPRRAPMKRMYVADAGNYISGGKGIKFKCNHCGHNTGWIKDNRSITENKRGLPCPKCNSEEVLK